MGKSGGDEDEVECDEFGLRGDDRFVFNLSGNSMVGGAGAGIVAYPCGVYERGRWQRVNGGVEGGSAVRRRSRRRRRRR